MCVKFLPKNLNPGPNPPHLTSTYTCRVTTASMVHGGMIVSIININRIVQIYIYDL